MDKVEQLEGIYKARDKAIQFFDSLKIEGGFKYTANHNVTKYPSAILYGTWSVVLGKKLLNKSFAPGELEFLEKSFLSHRNNDGTFLPSNLLSQKPSKSFEYLKLHCSNYSLGALLEINPHYDFQSEFFDKFLDADFLRRWLDQRAFNRPWEESNNIVNVASYLALCNDSGNKKGGERLHDMLDWHSKYQNPMTGGFDNFSNNGYKNSQQSMAGAVHNFHIHLYLRESYNYEEIIASNVVKFLFEGPLTACLSIDFVELGIRTLPLIQDKEPLVSGLLYHLEGLLRYQNSDGGWYENELPNKPTTAAGMKEDKASSCSYSTWFRLCSLGMIAIVLLGDDPKNWSFRKTLGMGYSPDYWPKISEEFDIEVNKTIKNKYKVNALPQHIKKKIINYGAKLLKG